MSFTNYGLKMQAAAFQLQLAFDADDGASMQDALRRMDAIERAHMRQKALATILSAEAPSGRSTARVCGRLQLLGLATYILTMCGRFTRYYTWEQIWRAYNLEPAGGSIPNLRPRYNVCPTDPVDVVLPTDDGRGFRFEEMRWGLVPFWWDRPLKELKLATFNARAETVDTKPFFREPFKSRRCLMPVSGYYEWEDTPEGKQPHYFTARDGSPVLTIAALWDQWTDRANPTHSFRSCTMIITEANDFVGGSP